ncbi:hypothetical protein RF55_23771, partial [Lasius niger]
MHPCRIGHGLLDADDLRMLAQGRHGCRQQVAARAQRHVIQQHRQAALLGYAQIVSQQTILGGAHIVRGHHQRTVRAQRGSAPRRLHGLGRRRLAAAGIHRHSAADPLQRIGEQTIILLRLQHMRLAGGAGHYQTLRTALDLKIKEPTEGFQIQTADWQKRRDQGADASPHIQCRPIPSFLEFCMLLAGQLQGQAPKSLQADPLDPPQYWIDWPVP